MPEQETRMEIYRVGYICDECGKGGMRWSDYDGLLTDPPYPHQCDSCGATKLLSKTYPRIERRPIEE